MEIRESAEEIKIAYRKGAISYAETKKELAPYIKQFNEKSVEIAKKYRLRPQKISVQAYLR